MGQPFLHRMHMHEEPHASLFFSLKFLTDWPHAVLNPFFSLTSPHASEPLTAMRNVHVKQQVHVDVGMWLWWARARRDRWPRASRNYLSSFFSLQENVNRPYMQEKKSAGP
jgi:hypothetical protein